jgi:hypothetical protein
LKRIASILLLGILLFNWVGFRLLVSFMEKHHDAGIEARLDCNDYNESELITLKVPVTHLSYYNNSSLFERVDGQIEINGIAYKYVKRRLYNDSIELVCIPNPVSIQLKNAKDDFFKIANDLQNTSQNKKGSSHSRSKIFSVDCYILNNISLLGDLFFSGSKQMINQHFHLLSPAISYPGQPPQTA